MASEILIALVTKLYEVVQTVQGNKERCKEISQRAQRLVPALRRVSSSGEQEVRIEHDKVSLAHSFRLHERHQCAATRLDVNDQIRRVCFYYAAPSRHQRNCVCSVVNGEIRFGFCCR